MSLFLFFKDFIKYTAKKSSVCEICIPSSSSLTSLAALSPSARSSFSICFDLSDADLSPALAAQPISAFVVVVVVAGAVLRISAGEPIWSRCSCPVIDQILGFTAIHKSILISIGKSSKRGSMAGVVGYLPKRSESAECLEVGLAWLCPKKIAWP